MNQPAAQILSDYDLYLLGEGNQLRLYDKLGAHLATREGTEGVAFVVFAPNAQRVSVVGDFNAWDGNRHPMQVRGQGYWETFVPGTKPGDRYKFEIVDRFGHLLPLKSDPVAFAAEVRPLTASVVVDPSTIPHPSPAPADINSFNKPISIYEVHLGSWRRSVERDGGWLTYRELAEQLPAYVRDMGFTHVELLPVSEHPFDGSWGYQPTGLFAPTSRFGSPADFAHLVDAFHKAGIGVLLDWVPGHFPDDPHGLARFDGTGLYEHEDPRQGRHLDWGTLIYNYGRTEVTNFLLSNALFWFDRYGIDGLRVDAVASMLYLDYSRPANGWIPNKHGGRENIDAIDFLRRTNTEVFRQYPHATTVAEESTAWPQVSRPVDWGGLGFGYKWNMGWMNDTLDYMSKDPIHRRYHHGKILFGLHPADAGEVLLRGQALKPHPSLMARDGVAYVPEGRGVFPGLTVKEIFTLALWSASLDAGEGRARIDEVLEILPKLKDFWSKRAGQLSGGQQQMVSIGRALLSRPDILLLDEPSIGLAPKLFQDLITPIRAIQQSRGMSILLVEQNVGEAFAVSDRVVAMKSGALIYEGLPADLTDRTKLLTLF